jgi:hypothetical protein
LAASREEWLLSGDFGLAAIVEPLRRKVISGFSGNLRQYPMFLSRWMSVDEKFTWLQGNCFAVTGRSNLKRAQKKSEY